MDSTKLRFFAPCPRGLEGVLEQELHELGVPMTTKTEGGHEIQSMLIRAQEMARYVEDGHLDCGLTGLDWVLEQNADVVEVAELRYAKEGFRPVQWGIAVPVDSKIRSVIDLKGKRVATELVGFTRRYLRSR